jgi:outer membrane protein assembly factor BamB
MNRRDPLIVSRSDTRRNPRMSVRLSAALTLLTALLVSACSGPAVVTADDKPITGTTVLTEVNRDWPMYGGTPSRNMVNTRAKNIPTTWGTKSGGANVKWVTPVSDKGYVPPAVAGGQIYVATSNHKPRDPKVKGEKAVLMCFKEATGEFLWQIATDMPPTAHNGATGKDDGLFSTPVVEGDRLYYVTPAAEVICADTKDGKVVWRLDMMKELKVSPFFVTFCSPLIAGDLVFAVTGNGRNGDELEKPAPEPKAPSFVAVNKKTGKLAWSDNSPGEKIMEGQWASPVYAEVKGQGQVIFPGGDGWLYAFEPATGKPVWKFDCNPKGAEFKPGGKGKANYLMAPTVAGDKLYTSVGQQPDNDPGYGQLWCVDITKTGDVSAELAKGKANPNSGVVWQYSGDAPKGADRDWIVGRSISGWAVHDGLAYVSDMEGFLYCFDALTGKEIWEHDTKAAIWASPLWVDGKVYLADASGYVHVFAHGKEKKLLAKVEMDEAIKASPVVANGVLYLMTEKRLYAIAGK